MHAGTNIRYWITFRMKVRVKGTAQKVFDVTDLADLHAQVTRSVGENETVILSLNGSDPLPSEGPLGEAGIVNGDLLRIISNFIAAPTAPSTSQAPHVPSTSHSVNPSPPATITSIEDIFKKYHLKVQSATNGQRVLQYSHIPGANIMYIEQSVGAMTLVNIIVAYGGETFVESVAGEGDYMDQVDAAFEKQLEKLRHAANLRPLGGLLSLPDELLINVLSRLNAASLVKAGMVCTKLKAVADSDDFWQALYLKDFTTIQDQNTSWRRLYAEAARVKRDRERQARRTQSEPRLPIHPLRD